MNKARREVITAIAGVSLGLVTGLKVFEGKKNTAYVERVAGNKVVTVCYGHTATAKLGQTYTDGQCNELLRQDLDRVYAPAVRRLVKVPLHQYEFDALVDFAYNAGVGNLAGSTLLKLVNRGEYRKAADEFPKWKYVNKKDCSIPANKCAGILRRRAWERSLFLGEFQ